VQHYRRARKTVKTAPPPAPDPPAQKDFCIGKKPEKIPEEAEQTTDAPLTRTSVSIKILYTDNQVEVFSASTVPRVADHGTLLFVDDEGQVQNVRLLTIKRWVWKKVKEEKK